MQYLLLAHLGIPLLFGVTFVVLTYLSGPEDALGSELVVEAALDLSILSIGATAAIFENDRLLVLFKTQANLMVAGMTVVALNFLLAAFVLALRKAIYKDKNSIAKKRTCAFVAIFCGSLTLGCICLPVVLAFQVSNPGKNVDDTLVTIQNPSHAMSV